MDIIGQLGELESRVSSLESNYTELKTPHLFEASSATPTAGQANTLSFPIDPLTRKMIRQIFQETFSIVVPNTSAATAANYGPFFIASAPIIVVGLQEAHSTLGTDASAVTLQVEQLTGTQAKGAGTNLLSTAFDLKAAINTVQTGTIVSSVATNLKAGDRLGLVTSGTLTAVAHVVVTVTYQYA